jgi:hypothetical protein
MLTEGSQDMLGAVRLYCQPSPHPIKTKRLIDVRHGNVLLRELALALVGTGRTAGLQVGDQ